MKKTLPFLFLVLLSFLTAVPVRCGVIPLQQARQAAEQFLMQVSADRTPQLQLLFEQPRLTKAGPAEPEYYIFSDKRGGFVIASGDDGVPAILGYSTRSAIRTEGMPENLRGWLDMWARIVEGVRSGELAPCQGSVPLKSGSSKQLVTADWNQSAPFNLYCIEMEDGKHAVTGCTATAAAIVLRYHQWPEKGTGTLPSYSVADASTGKSYTIPEQVLGRKYDWSKMPLKYDGTWSDEQKDEVAFLMRDLGVMIKSQYSTTGTGAYLEDVGPGLVRHMFYDAGYSMDYKGLYDSNEDWVAALKENIDKVGPVLYGAQSGGDSPAGHAFILDGYDEQDYLHINWGWGGSGNGFFVMPAFNEYTEGHQAILGLKKDAGGIPVENIQLYNVGLTSPSASFTKGKTFTVTCRSVANYGETEFSGDIALAKYNREDRFVELVCEAVPVTIPSWNTVTLSDVACVIRTEILPGDYIRAVYRSSRTPDWTLVRYDHDRMIIGRLPVGDLYLLDEIVSLAYDASSGQLIVTFSQSGSCSLLAAGGKTVTTGVITDGDVTTIDAKQLAPATYTLRLKRGSQQKDIQFVFGLKK